jgi:hypothetical protein
VDDITLQLLEMYKTAEKWSESAVAPLLQRLQEQLAIAADKPA